MTPDPKNFTDNLHSLYFPLSPVRQIYTLSRSNPQGEKNHCRKPEEAGGNGNRSANAKEHLLAAGQLLDGGSSRCSGRPTIDLHRIIPLSGKGAFPSFLVCDGLFLSGMVPPPDLGRPEAGEAKGSSAALSGFLSERVGAFGGYRRRRRRGVFPCQASFRDPSGRSFLPVRLQLLSSPAYLSQMVAPACLSISAERRVRLIHCRGL
jgi:hypothetical protein